MRATRPHISVVGYKTEECTKLFHVLGRLHRKNSFDFLWIWFDTTMSEPMSKEVSFLNGPFAFARVDNKALFSKPSEDFVDKFNVRIKTLTETGNVVNVYFDVDDVMAHKFHDFLSNVRRLTYPHGPWGAGCIC